MSAHRIKAWIWAVAAVSSGIVAWEARPTAQRNQPIYPAYDGFVRNDDGSYTIAFAYFSHNAELVGVAPGPHNVFAPTPADRQQPTTFKPGHHRFQCVMVVGPEFDGKVRWTLTYGGATTSTSERMLQSNWNLVEGAAELKKIDYAKVPRGVCLNRAPTVRVLGLRAGRGGAPPAMTAKLSEPLNLFGSVADEGLPRTSPLVAGWKQVSGPGTVTFAPPDIRTRATFSARGTYVLELSATDSEFSTRMVVRVTVE